MPRSLSFVYQGKPLDFSLEKVDRGKLYGNVSTETLDVEKRRCELVTLAYDGRTVIPYGGTALGYMNAAGLWIERDELVAVDLDGEALPTVKSSFKETIDLAVEVSTEEFLDHSVRLCYRLNPVETLDKDFATVMKGGAIFKFSFSYRGGVSVDPAFILENDDAIWLLISNVNRVEYANLAQAAVCARADEPEETGEESEDLDFGML